MMGNTQKDSRSCCSEITSQTGDDRPTDGACALDLDFDPDLDSDDDVDDEDVDDDNEDLPDRRRESGR